MPFDQFTARAARRRPAARTPTTEQKIATCYNRLLQTTHEGGVQAKEYLAKYAADRVRNLSAVWMGATVGCAECHDHKFDPYTRRTSTRWPRSSPTWTRRSTSAAAARTRSPTKRAAGDRRSTTRRERERLAELDAQIAELEKQPATSAKKQLAALDAEARRARRSASGS